MMYYIYIVYFTVPLKYIFQMEFMHFRYISVLYKYYIVLYRAVRHMSRLHNVVREKPGSVTYFVRASHL